MSTLPQPPDILSPEFAADPYPAYRILREHHPLFHDKGTDSYLLSRYEDVARAFREPVFTTDNYEWQLEPAHGGRTLPQMSGREHAVRRALVAPAFRGRELREKFLPVIERNARELIDAFRDDAEADLVGRFATRFPINVIVDMLGLDRADHDRFHGWYASVVGFVSNLAQDPGIAAAGRRAGEELAAYLRPILAERRAAPRDDLLSGLCTAEVEGTRMNDQDITSFVSLLLAAGGETTDKVLAALFRNLLAHPDQFAAVRADRSLIPAAFAETLRYTPPVQMIMRQPAAEVTLSGGTVPAGATVTCLIGSANRDERRYARPAAFDLFRTDLTTATAFSAAADHVAFSLGRHFCVGALLAKTEIEVGVNQLLDAFPAMSFAEDTAPADEGVFTRGPARLRVRLRPGVGAARSAGTA
ncbi:pulcherriminic acid synthase [Streptomyces sp. 2224.1]|uniref:cytochrome P450 n=1 Tax=unclassified Streptomyces TaxID=2593676 RepID=UPI0008920855|nr:MULTISPECIES: cytochrome P450 [unclassified Streptomyces]PBC86810.1 pulcherriminic acid synthase [Streptomyces sp. 2321.6]SDQ71689.1 pulcherriminic acid synthase [Streptomyces sp. KS_16]SED81154.1 pulcherriminic acid synthase [Streptomyces sp. 2224.1]SEE10141.1 pulcherriminic acid synthase [Streptomyces sp. 2133.1]SNC73986.1 pulcherriminic acid synthase [Streptomyces sp. 2114.4]